jgi:hypothetical protein
VTARERSNPAKYLAAVFAVARRHVTDDATCDRPVILVIYQFAKVI